MTAKPFQSQLHIKIGQTCSMSEETVRHEAGVQVASQADGGGQGGTKQVQALFLFIA